MFIAMNRFRIAPGREAEFIEVWRQRDSRLAVPATGPEVQRYFSIHRLALHLGKRRRL